MYLKPTVSLKLKHDYRHARSHTLTEGGACPVCACIVTCEYCAFCMLPVENWACPLSPARSTAGRATEPVVGCSTLELWCWMMVALQQKLSVINEVTRAHHNAIQVALRSITCNQRVKGIYKVTYIKLKLLKLLHLGEEHFLLWETFLNTFKRRLFKIDGPSGRPPVILGPQFVAWAQLIC